MANVPIVDWYGQALTDQQRVDRYNDLRAFQMMVDSSFCPNQMREVRSFLETQKARRTKDEVLQFLELRAKHLIPDSKV